MWLLPLNLSGINRHWLYFFGLNGRENSNVKKKGPRGKFPRLSLFNFKYSIGLLLNKNHIINIKKAKDNE